MPGDVRERDEERRVHDEVGSRVEIPPGERDAARRARELPVAVVEQRLQLQEQCRGDELTASECERRRSSPATAFARTTAGGGTRSRRRAGTSRFDSGSKTHSRRSSRPARRDSAATGAPVEGGSVEIVMVDGDRRYSPRDPGGLDEVDDALERTFELPTFPEALAFVNRVGELAEAENHHPDIAIHYRQRDAPLVDAHGRRHHRSRPRARAEVERARLGSAP